MIQSNRQKPFNAAALCILMAAICFNLTPFKVSAASQLTAEDLFKPDHLLDVQIKMTEEDFKNLRSQSDRGKRDMGAIFRGETPTSPFTQFKADVTIDGSTIKEVGIRTKGFIGSLNTTRPSFKIKFDEYVDQSPVKGLDRITLNNNIQDESLASQYLTYKLFNKAGIPAPRVSFAKVSVNGEHLGVYSHVESVRSPFLDHHFGDDSGEFYEGTLTDFHPRTVDNIEAKNKRTRKDKSRAIELAKLLETQEGFRVSEADRLVNLEQFIRFWAMENLIAFWDGYSNNQNNYFAYTSPKDGDRFHFMPWGADGAFIDLSGPFGRMNRGMEPKVVYGQGMLNNRLYHSEGIPARYKAAMKDLLKDVWNESEILSDIQRIHKLVGHHLHEKQDKLQEGTEKVTEFVKGRRAEIESEIENWPVEMGDARIPAHTVKVGTLKGSFSTVWKNERPESIMKQGEVTLELVIEGKNVTLKNPGIIGQLEDLRRGWRRGEPKPTIALQGIRESDGHIMNITFAVEKDAFTASNDEGTPFQGMLMTINPNGNRGGFGGFQMPKSLTGKLHLKEASNDENAPISGEFDVIIQESKGGMFGNRNRGGRGPGRGGPPQRGGRPRGGRPPGS